MADASRITDDSLPKLHTGERVIAEFRPKFTLFLQRSVLLGIATTLGFGLVPGLDITFAQQVALALVIVLLWAFVFDEWREWVDRRKDRWVLTNHRLILLSPDENDGQAWLNLDDIASVKIWMWWALRVAAQDGRVTIMSYVGPVRRVRRAIEQAAAQE